MLDAMWASLYINFPPILSGRFKLLFRQETEPCIQRNPWSRYLFFSTGGVHHQGREKSHAIDLLLNIIRYFSPYSIIYFYMEGNCIPHIIKWVFSSTLWFYRIIILNGYYRALNQQISVASWTSWYTLKSVISDDWLLMLAVSSFMEPMHLLKQT